MGLVSSAVGAARPAGQPRSGLRIRACWLILGGYLLAAVALTWRLWADPASRMQTGDITDVNLFAWFIRYAAVSVAHGSLPSLVNTAMNAPQGINLMWNTSLLLPGVLLTPVTLLAGPQTSLTVLLTLGFAGSAAALFWVLLRWGASIGAAALGGAVYGFSPALLASSIGHYHLQFAVLPPLMIDALLRIVTGRGHPLRSGAWLGLLVAAQLFTGEELVVDTALAGLVMLAVLAASAPREVRARAVSTVAGLAVAAGVTLLIAGYGLWVQFHGPLAEHGGPWTPNRYRNRAAAFVTPSGDLWLHTHADAVAIASHPLERPEYVAYLGWPLLIVLLVAAVRYWRSWLVRIPAVTCAVLELLSLGGTQVVRGVTVPRQLLPWHWLAHLPILDQVLPDRLSILADGMAAAVLAFALDRALAGAGATTSRPGPASRWRRAVPAAIAALAVLPLIPLPIHTTQVAPVPAGWQTVFARLQLARNAPVLVVPTASGQAPQALRWYAETGQPGSMSGGYFIGPDHTGRGRMYGGRQAKAAATSINAMWLDPVHGQRLSSAQFRGYLARWRPAAVVAVTRRTSRLGRLLSAVLGRPGFAAGRVLGWRR
ncbi:MAG TPA: hypothetical protein VIP48_03875 [Streptosporangiaceae bacterium]